MSKVGNVVQDLFEASKEELGEAGWRVVAKQLPLRLREPLIKQLKKKKVDSALVESLAKFLETDLGLSTFSFALGLGLGNLPWFSENEKAQKLAKELQLEGVTSLGHLGVETLVGFLGPFIKIAADTINELPAAPGVKDTKIKIPPTLLQATNGVKVEVAEKGPKAATKAHTKETS